LDNTFFKNNAVLYVVQVDIPPTFEINTINKFISTDSTGYDKVDAGYMY
jgi:hypothetical protein